MEYFTHIGDGRERTRFNIFSDMFKERYDPTIREIAVIIRSYVKQFNWHNIIGKKMQCYIENDGWRGGYSIEIHMPYYHSKVMIDEHLLKSHLSINRIVEREIDLLMQSFLFGRV